MYKRLYYTMKAQDKRVENGCLTKFGMTELNSDIQFDSLYHYLEKHETLHRVR